MLFIMNKISEEEAINLLKKYSTSQEQFDKILKHSRAVQNIALRIASRCSDVDLYKIKMGSLLHDIGRFSCPPGPDSVKHGIVGGAILRNEGLEDIALIAERHVGAGISKRDIIEYNLPLPEKDFLPITKEEKIITHADNLVFGSKEGSFDEVVDRYKQQFGNHILKRIKKLKQDVDRL